MSARSCACDQVWVVCTSRCDWRLGIHTWWGCCKLCARCGCPEIRMSPRILVAIKRRPAVSPSAYGTECRWRLEKAIFWNAGNAVGTGPKAAPPPQLTAPHQALHSHLHNLHNTPSSWAVRGCRQRHFPAFLSQDCSPACPREGEPWATPYSCGAPASPRSVSPGALFHDAPAPGGFTPQL